MLLLHRLLRLNCTKLTVVNWNTINGQSEHDLFYTQKRFAARKGKRIAATREKQRLARLKREELKKQPPKTWKSKQVSINSKEINAPKRFSDVDRRSLSEIVDNVYVINQYKEKKFPLLEAVQFLRDSHDPSIYDEPNALVEAFIELNLKTKKKTKFLSNLSGVVCYPNLFQSTKRKVIAIAETEEQQEEAKDAGAELTGSSDIIRMLKVGDITIDNFDELVCHEDMLASLGNIRALLGTKLPSKLRGNIGTDMRALVTYFMNGIEFKMKKEYLEPDYGSLQVPFGRLSFTDQQLKENFDKLLQVIDDYQPEGAPGEFITRVLISSEPSNEKFAIAIWEHIDGYEDPNIIEDDEDDNNEQDQKLIKIGAK